MHTALQLAPVLAEKSKTPFYIAGGILVAWALFISMAVGMRRPDFPKGLSQQRLVMGVTVLLVLATVSCAVIVSGGEAKPASASATTTATTSVPAETSTAPGTTSTAASTPSSSTPTATTGTPPPASSPAAKATSVALAADPGGQLAYSTKTLTATAGTVSIVMTNSSPVEHNVTVAEGSKVLGQTPTFVGGAKTLTLKLKPGTYVFYCSVPGHRQAGMEGKLVVTG